MEIIWQFGITLNKVYCRAGWTKARHTVFQFNSSECPRVPWGCAGANRAMQAGSAFHIAEPWEKQSRSLFLHCNANQTCTFSLTQLLLWLPMRECQSNSEMSLPHASLSHKRHLDRHTHHTRTNRIRVRQKNRLHPASQRCLSVMIVTHD